MNSLYELTKLVKEVEEKVGDMVNVSIFSDGSGNFQDMDDNVLFDFDELGDIEAMVKEYVKNVS